MRDFAPHSLEAIPFMMGELKTTRREILEASNRAESILEKIESLDSIITEASTEYSFERISRVEKCILRLGLFELLFDTAIPPKVAIAEGIRLCRKFGTNESAQFINAILDGVYKKHAAPVPDEPALI